FQMDEKSASTPPIPPTSAAPAQPSVSPSYPPPVYPASPPDQDGFPSGGVPPPYSPYSEIPLNGSDPRSYPSSSMQQPTYYVNGANQPVIDYSMYSLLSSSQSHFFISINGSTASISNHLSNCISYFIHHYFHNLFIHLVVVKSNGKSSLSSI
ncbi:hypothetical protein PFISCL1PPCAC_15429, partial [Pristionchus fissidentatus]